MNQQFGEYIVYVDESGDHSLKSINAVYPIFVLVFCIFRINSYIHDTVPAVQRLKFKWFGHDTVILHEREIRKRIEPFGEFGSPETYALFVQDLTELISNSEFTAIACVIDKYACLDTQYRDDDPYRIALEFGLERVLLHLRNLGQEQLLTQVIVESRGRKEDSDLLRNFNTTLELARTQGIGEAFQLRFVSKNINSSGLQIADMIARPIGIAHLNPDQPNRAWNAIQPKLRKSPNGVIEGWGLKVVPKKRETPENFGGS